MARSDWAALLTEPAAEYLAATELERFGLSPYLPQCKRRVHHYAGGRFVLRRYPLFPRYLLISIGEASNPIIRFARGLRKHRPLLADDDGRPWRAPSTAIEAIRLAEAQGRFDEVLHRGDKVSLSAGVLATVRAVLVSDGNARAELLTPLFGGARVTVDRNMLIHV